MQALGVHSCCVIVGLARDGTLAGYNPFSTLSRPPSRRQIAPRAKRGDRSACDASGAMTRDDKVRAIATDLKILARIFALKRLTLFEAADAPLNRELRALIDDDDRNSTGV